MMASDDLNEKVLYKGWLPVDDELDDSSEEESRLHLEAVMAMVAIPKESMTDAWSGVLSGLQALGIALQSAHWRAAGEASYSDHLLYQKLYENVIEDLDNVAEKFMGLVGDETVIDPIRLLACTSSAAKQMLTSGDIAASLLQAEKNFLGRLNGILKILETTGQLTPGAENVLQAVADRHETHVYLLSRRVGKEIIRAVVKAV